MKLCAEKELFFHPPSLEQLVDEVIDKRKKRRKKKVALTVVTCRDDHRLRCFLNSLKQQTFQDFDVIVVYAPGDEIVEEKELSILHVKTKRDFGPAGGFFLAQVIVMAEGYEFFAMFDTDRPFAEPDSLATLLGEIENYDMVSGISYEHYLKGPHGSGVALGSLFRTEALKKSGFYYLPILFGDEEIEFALRCLTSLKIKWLDKIITYHPEFSCEQADIGGLRKFYRLGMLLRLCFQTKQVNAFSEIPFPKNWYSSSTQLSPLFPNSFIRVNNKLEAKISFYALVIRHLLLSFFPNAFFTIDESFNKLARGVYCYPEPRFAVKEMKQPRKGLSVFECQGVVFKSAFFEKYLGRNKLTYYLDRILAVMIFSLRGGRIAFRKDNKIFITEPTTKIPSPITFFLSPFYLLKWWLIISSFTKDLPDPKIAYSFSNVRHLLQEWKTKFQ